jgi:phospholipid/cholesterol/gamma-HCH transport system ATP-binding protein
LISDGVVAVHGPAAEMKVSRDPFVRQFLDGAPDGPVPFHYPYDAYKADLGLTTAG